MAAIVMSFIVSLLSIASLMFYGWIQLHFAKSNFKYKKVSFWFFIASVVIAVLSLIFTAIYDYLGTNYNIEILMNISSLFFLMLILMGLAFVILWFSNDASVKSSDNKFLNKILKLQKHTRITFYVLSAVMLVMWIAFTVVGDFIKSRESIQIYLSGKFSFIWWVFLIIFLLMIALLVTNFAFEIIAFIKYKLSKEFLIKSIYSVIAYILISLTFMLIFLGIYNIDDMHNFFGRELLSFMTSEYTNSYSYMLVYFDLIGISLMSITYIKARK